MDKRNLNALEVRLNTFSGVRLPGAKARTKKTVVHWPHITPKPADLAAAGFFFDPTPNNPDNTTCFLCNSSLDGWEKEDDPAVEHLAHSANCSWAKLVAKNWTSIDPSQLAQSSLNPHSKDSITCRLDTFNEWPHDSKKNWIATALNMARAGFFFNPVIDGDDTASCPYCEISLGGWEPEDNPIFEHERRSPGCVFFTIRADQSSSPRGKKRASSLSGVRRDSSTKKCRTPASIEDHSDGEIIKLPNRTTNKHEKDSLKSIVDEEGVVDESTPWKRRSKRITLRSEASSSSSVSTEDSLHIPGGFPKRKSSIRLKSASKPKVAKEPRHSVTVTRNGGTFRNLAEHVDDDTMEEELAQMEMQGKWKLKEERIAQEESERQQKEHPERESLEKERNEAEMLERARVEKERLKEKETLEQERLEHERLEKERLEKERLEKERLEKERLERERLEQERLEKERLEKGRLDQELFEQEKLERERRKQERLERKTFDLEKLEKEHENHQQQTQENLKQLIFSAEENWHRLSSSTTTTCHSDPKSKPFSLMSPLNGTLTSPVGPTRLTCSEVASANQKENLEPSTPAQDDNVPIESPQKWASTDLENIFRVLESVKSDFSEFIPEERDEGLLNMTVSQWFSSMAEKAEALMVTKSEAIIEIIRQRGEEAIAAVEAIPVTG